jgi:hypothetical protein
MERTIEQARKGTPMGAEQVREAIIEMDAQTKSKDARIAMARLAIKYGNISPEGKDLWRDYLRKNGDES